MDKDTFFPLRSIGCGSSVSAVAFLQDEAGEHIVTGHACGWIQCVTLGSERSGSWNCAALFQWVRLIYPRIQHLVSPRLLKHWNAVYTPKMAKLVSENGDKQVLLWDIDISRTREKECELDDTGDFKLFKNDTVVELRDNDDRVLLTITDGQSACFSPDGKKFAVGLRTGTIKLFGFRDLVKAGRG